jgi:hypothetical protein
VGPFISFFSSSSFSRKQNFFLFSVALCVPPSSGCQNVKEERPQPAEAVVLVVAKSKEKKTATYRHGTQGWAARPCATHSSQHPRKNAPRKKEQEKKKKNVCIAK